MIPGVILHKEETESTMDDARAAVEAGRGHGTVCSADRQRRGRGRMPGRRWENGDAAILFTLILRRDSVNSAYPLTQLLALALCRRLEGAYGVPVRIKWPNDVLADSRKIAGILVETQGEFYLAGIGLNVEVPAPAGPGGDLRRPAAGLAEWAAPPPSPPREIQALCEEIRRCLHTPPPLAEITRRLAGIRSEVNLITGCPPSARRITGTLLGLAEDGALRVELPNGEIQTLYSGEIDYAEKS